MATFLRDSTVGSTLAVSPKSNTTSHDSHEKMNAWVSFTFLYGYGALLDGSALLLFMANLPHWDLPFN